MRERAIEEFESIFERASIPVLDISELDIKRIAAVLTGAAADASVVELAAHLKTRFNADLRAHWAPDARPSLDAARDAGLTPAPDAFNTTAELVGRLSIERCQLVLLSVPEADRVTSVDIDPLVQGLRPPILIVRRPPDEPAAVFQTILHALTGNFRQTQNFAYSFTLINERGALKLLHIIDVKDLTKVCEALRVTPDIEAGQEKDLLDRMTHHGERYLKGVVAAGREMPYDVTYRLAVGDVQTAVHAELQSGAYGLLVVGQHSEGHSHIDAADYQLMHSIRHVPVLAL